MSDDNSEDDSGAKAKRGGVKLRVKPAVATTKPARSGVVVKKKDFVDRVAERAGVKKPDARSAVDAALAVIGEALAGGDELVLPPLGRLRLMREKDNGKSRVMTLRLQAMPEVEDKSDIGSTDDI